MSHRFCPQCKLEKPALTEAAYQQLRALFEGLERRARRHGHEPLAESFAPLYATYHELTGESEQDWVHIIVHNLGQTIEADDAISS
jgi:hypothetical protein